MSTITTYREDDGSIVLERLTHKGDFMTWVARVNGPAKEGDQFMFDMEFFARPKDTKPRWQKERNGTFTAVDNFKVNAGDILMTGVKLDDAGERKERHYYEVGSKGNLIEITREKVHEAFGLPFEDRSGGY
jgi:hypothetical protein